VDQLTFIRELGGSQGTLQSDSPVFLGWGRDRVLDIQVESQSPQRVANVLYYVPIGMQIRGHVSFTGDLIRQTTIDGDAAMFQKGTSMMVLGKGTMTVSYRPVSFNGNLSVDKVRLRLSDNPMSGIAVGNAGKAIEPAPMVCRDDPLPPDRPVESAPPDVACPVDEQDRVDGLPEVEVFDRSGAGTWNRLPHFMRNVLYSLDHPERYVDSAGVLLVRFVNDGQEPAGAFLDVSIAGTVQ
jgi:hypothetical protein